VLAQKRKQFGFPYSFHDPFFLRRKLYRRLPKRWSHISSP